MGVTINNESTTTEPPLRTDSSQTTGVGGGGGGLNEFYWYQIFALDSTNDQMDIPRIKSALEEM